MLKLSVPDPTILSGEDLKTFAIRQANLRLRSDRPDIDAVFTRGGETMLPDPRLLSRSNNWLLPGGSQLLIRTRNTLLLYQVLFSGESPTLSVLRTFDLESLGAHKKIAPGILLCTTSPHPVYVCIAVSTER